MRNKAIYYLLLIKCNVWILSVIFLLFSIPDVPQLLTFTTERFSETRRLSESITSEILKLWGSFLFQNGPNLVFQIIVFELVAVSSPHYYKNIRSPWSTCWTKNKSSHIVYLARRKEPEDRTFYLKQIFRLLPCTFTKKELSLCTFSQIFSWQLFHMAAPSSSCG